MEKAIKEAKNKVIEAQKQAAIDEITTLEIQIPFIEADLDSKIELAKKEKNEEQKEAMLENLNKQKLQQLHPMIDNKKYKTRYYEYLCGLES